MKRFILTRKIIQTERGEIEAESWEEAKKLLMEGVELKPIPDTEVVGQHIEFIGED